MILFVILFIYFSIIKLVTLLRGGRKEEKEK